MLTPTHLGPSLFFAALKPRVFNFWALILGSVLPDMENVVLVILNTISNCPKCYHHGFFHSILGAIVGSLFLALTLNFVLNRIKHREIVGDPVSHKQLFFSGVLGWLLHVLADSLVHRDVFLFWPLRSTPFLISWSLYWPLSYAFATLGIFSLTIIIIKMFKLRA